MTEEEAVARLIAIDEENGGYASEEGHAEADAILKSFAPKAVVEAYENVGKWYA